MAANRPASEFAAALTALGAAHESMVGRLEETVERQDLEISQLRAEVMRQQKKRQRLNGVLDECV